MAEQDLTQHNFDKFKKALYEAGVEINRLNEELKVQKHIITVMEERNKQLIEGKISTDVIIQQEMTKLNNLNNDYLQEIEGYKMRIAELVNSE